MKFSPKARGLIITAMLLPLTGCMSAHQHYQQTHGAQERQMTVSIRPRGTHQMIVRSSLQYNLQTIEDPEPYQYFFSTLSKALFMEAHPID